MVGSDASPTCDLFFSFRTLAESKVCSAPVKQVKSKACFATKTASYLKGGGSNAAQASGGHWDHRSQRAV